MFLNFEIVLRFLITSVDNLDISFTSIHSLYLDQLF